MNADRVIKCVNDNGVGITFTERKFDPFMLVSIDGIYTIANDVSLLGNTMMDGSTFQGSVAKERHIELIVKDIERFGKNRNYITTVFKSGSKGTLYYEDSETSTKEISYYVENIQSTGKFDVRYTTISLVCDDPFFYDTTDVSVNMASWIPLFEFPHEFKAEGEEFERRSSDKINVIKNENASNNIGMEIHIIANDTVVNPSVVRVEGDEKLVIGYGKKPYTMSAGDEVIITTSTGNKHVYEVRNGVKKEINQYLTEDSTYIQLQRGNNSIGYNATNGEENMTISISYKLKFARV